MSETKITTRTVRVMLSHNFCNFEYSATLENENGVSFSEVETVGKETQSLAMAAVAEYKRLPNPNAAQELKLIEKRVKDIAEMVHGKEPEKEADPKEVEAIQQLPEYQPKKAITGKTANEFLGRPKTKHTKK